MSEKIHKLRKIILDFCMYEDNKHYLMKNFIIPQNLYENYLVEILKDFIDSINKESNYNIVINSFFNLSGVGKSLLALFLIQLMLELFPHFSFRLMNDISEFTNSDIIQERCIYLIDDSQFSEIGLGTKRMKQQLNDFFNISARFNQVCFLFTTTYGYHKLRFLMNIRKWISVIGYNEETMKTCSYVYSQNFDLIYLLFTGYPNEKILTEYNAMKSDYTKSFLIGQQKNNLKTIVKKVLEKPSVYKLHNESISSLETFVSLKYGFLSGNEVKKVARCLKMIFDDKLGIDDLD